MASDNSKGTGLGSIDMCSQVEFRGFNGKSCGVGPDKYDTTKLVAGGEVQFADVGNLISPISVEKEELYAEENQQTNMRNDLDKFKPSQLRSDEGTTLERLTSLKEEESNNMFGIGDLVWGKVMSHPWWPGQIYDESLIPYPLCDDKRDGSVLVTFYGDYSYAWLNLHQIIPFEPHFEEKSKKSKLQTFIVAVEEAIYELKKRTLLGLTCFCQGNFQPTTIEGFYKVDVSGYTPGIIYSSKQIKKYRDGFQPHGMFSFVKKLAMSPRSSQNLHRIINSAKVTAYRKMVFEENDETYEQAFVEFEKGDETYGQAFGVKASSSEDHIEFSKEGNQFTVWKDGQKYFEDQGDCSKKSCKGETKRKRRKEFPPDEQGCTGKFRKDAFFDHLVTKSGEEIEGIYCCKSEKHNKLNDYGAELGNATGAFKHLKQFRSTSYQEIYYPEEHEKRILLKCQDEHMTRKEELRGLKCLHMTKKYGDQNILTSHGNDVDIQSILSVQSEKMFTEEPEREAEPTMLVIKFSPQTMLPTASELKAKFACFGPFDESALRISWGSATCQIVFMYKSNAQAAYDYAVESKTLFNSDVNYHLTDFDGSVMLMGENFDDIQSFKGEPRHMSFQELPLQSDTEMKSLSKENSKCRSDVEKDAFLNGNTDTNSIVCDYPEVDASSEKVNIGAENCQVVLSEILCASSPVSSSIQYKHKVGSRDEIVEAINAKYSMDEGWKSHYQQNLNGINSSDLSLQLANLFQKCNEILGGIEGSQDQFSRQS